MDANLKNEDLDASRESLDKTWNKKRKMIIDLMVQLSKENDFNIGRNALKSFRSISADELAFIDEVYDILQGLNIGEDIKKVKGQEQLKEKLYNYFQISKEVLEEEQQEDQVSDKLGQQEPRVQVIEGSNKKEFCRKDLYRPEFLCGHNVELVKYSEERAEHTSKSYQFAGRTYIFRKIGKLLYMSTPNLQESLTQYEITISKGDLSKTITRFGEISFNRMSEPNYNTMIFLQLLEVGNLMDKELQGYIGRLEQVRDKNGRLKNEYKVVHIPEEYTAIMIWKEIEKAREEKEQTETNSSIQGKVAGGDER